MLHMNKIGVVQLYRRELHNRPSPCTKYSTDELLSRRPKLFCWKPRESVAKNGDCERYAGLGGLIIDLKLQVANEASSNTTRYLSFNRGKWHRVSCSLPWIQMGYSQRRFSNRTIPYNIRHCYAVAALSLLKSTCRDTWL